MPDGPRNNAVGRGPSVLPSVRLRQGRNNPVFDLPDTIGEGLGDIDRASRDRRYPTRRVQHRDGDGPVLCSFDAGPGKSFEFKEHFDLPQRIKVFTNQLSTPSMRLLFDHRPKRPREPRAQKKVSEASWFHRLGSGSMTCVTPRSDPRAAHGENNWEILGPPPARTGNSARFQSWTIDASIAHKPRMPKVAGNRTRPLAVRRRRTALPLRWTGSSAA